MAIHKLSKLRKRKQFIDLSGPDGNAFMLLGRAQRLCAELGKDWSDVRTRMIAGDYENLIKVFDEEFGDFIDLYR